MIAALHRAGADAFRVNMSHGDHAGHAQAIAAIRALEKETGRPTTILVDLQGPKLRVGTFKAGPAELVRGKRFVLDSDKAPGDATRVHLPHPELFAALEPGTRSEEHTSELQSLMRISYAVFCLTKKKR